MNHNYFISIKNLVFLALDVLMQILAGILHVIFGERGLLSELESIRPVLFLNFFICY